MLAELAVARVIRARKLSPLPATLDVVPRGAGFVVVELERARELRAEVEAVGALAPLVEFRCDLDGAVLLVTAADLLAAFESSCFAVSCLAADDAVGASR